MLWMLLAAVVFVTVVLPIALMLLSVTAWALWQLRPWQLYEHLGYPWSLEWNEKIERWVPRKKIKGEGL